MLRNALTRLKLTDSVTGKLTTGNLGYLLPRILCKSIV